MILNTYKNITYLEKYYYSNEVYPHEVIWNEYNSSLISEMWGNFCLSDSFKNEKLSLVVNIPFCETKCFYCTHEVTVSTNEKIDQYLDFLEKEIIIYSKQIKNKEIHSLYIWWWTPTILNEIQLERLYKMLFTNFNLSSLHSNMIEFSPNTFSKEKIEIISRYGVNKVTFWVQDIDEGLMKENNRIQLKESILSMVNALKESGVFYINADIMAWIKWQTLDNFKNTFNYVSSLHLSNICLNTFKPTNKVLYWWNWMSLLNDSYLLEREKMIQYFHKNYKKWDTKQDLYTFDSPGDSFLLLGFWTNGHIFWKLHYKHKSLENYYNYVLWKESLVFAYKIDITHEIVKYILLSLPGKWVSFSEVQQVFWENEYMEILKKKLLLLEEKWFLVTSFIEGEKYYKFKFTSDLLYSLYSKIFYHTNVIDTYTVLDLNKKLDTMDIDNYLKFYFLK